MQTGRSTQGTSRSGWESGGLELREHGSGALGMRLEGSLGPHPERFFMQF